MTWFSDPVEHYADLRELDGMNRQALYKYIDRLETRSRQADRADQHIRELEKKVEIATKALTTIRDWPAPSGINSPHTAESTPMSSGRKERI